MSEIKSRQTIATLTIRGRDYEINCLTMTIGDTLLFDVTDVGTGLPLTAQPLPSRPDAAAVEELLERLADDLDTDRVEEVFSGEYHRLAQAVGRTFVIEGRWINVRLSQRLYWYDQRAWDLLENGIVLNAADPFTSAPTGAQVSSFLTPAKRHLDALMAAHRIVAGPDYQYEDVYAVLHGPTPPPRYVAITRDETYTFFALTSERNDACAILADRLGEETGGTIVGIHDLDRDLCLEVRHTSTVWVIDERPPETPLPT